MNKIKPFIHLFKSINHCYLFDVNTNQICRIDEDVYNYLEKEQNGEENIESAETTLKKINELKEWELLLSNRPKKIVHSQDRFLEYRLNNSMNKITLQVTQNCNFRCSYCIYSEQKNPMQRKHSNKRMPWEMAKRGIDFLIDHSSAKFDINVGFYGGEPLLEFELIKKCIEYCQEISESKRISYSITSNGTLLNDEIVEFFMKHDVSLLISLDGPAEIHDQHRKFKADGSGSFSTVWSNLKRVEKKYPDFFKKIRYNCVVNPQNNLKCLNEFFSCNSTLKDIPIYLNVQNDNYSNVRHIPSKEYLNTKAYELFKAYLYKMKLIKEESISTLARFEYSRFEKEVKQLVYTRPFQKLDHPSGPCIPGVVRLLMDVNGNFFPCERVSELSKTMAIGNLNEGFKINKIRKLLNVGQITGEECKHCWAFRHCGSCASTCDNMESLSKELRLSRCNSIRNGFDDTLRNYVLMNEIEATYKMNKLMDSEVL